MRRVVCSMSVSLDGYVTDPDRGFGWTDPDPELFRFITDQTRRLSAYVLGRRLYETMLYWETAGQDAALDDDSRAWAEVWIPLPKLVFSTTLTEVEGNARLAAGGLAEELAALDGEVAIGGPTLAGAAARLGLVDEYHPRVHPVLVGGGLPLYPPVERRQELELVESRPFASAVWSRYRVIR
jgi:dihydrofolate reductase